MTSFDEREHGFEAKFAHESEMLFKAEARRDRLVGLWAAGLLGKSGEAVRDYINELIGADLRKPGSTEVEAKLIADLKGRATEEQVRNMLAELLIVARAQVQTDS